MPQKYFIGRTFNRMLGSTLLSYTSYATKIKKQGLRTPFTTLSQRWEPITMDYMSDVPFTKDGNDCVVMIIEKLSKMTILASYKKSITIGVTTELFFE